MGPGINLSVGHPKIIRFIVTVLLDHQSFSCRFFTFFCLPAIVTTGKYQIRIISVLTYEGGVSNPRHSGAEGAEAVIAFWAYDWPGGTCNEMNRTQLSARDGLPACQLSDTVNPRPSS